MDRLLTGFYMEFQCAGKYIQVEVGETIT